MDGPLAFGLGGAVVTALYAGTLVFLESFRRAVELTRKQLINNKLDAAHTTIKNKAAHLVGAAIIVSALPGFSSAGFDEADPDLRVSAADATVYLHSLMKPQFTTAVVWFAFITAVTYQRLLLPLLKLLIAAVADAFDPVVNASALLLASQLQLTQASNQVCLRYSSSIRCFNKSAACNAGALLLSLC